MLYQSEVRPRSWRAIAVFDDLEERLLFVGRSRREIQANYSHAFCEILDEEERGHVRSIFLQRWQSTSTSGRWFNQAELDLPELDLPPGPGVLPAA